MTDQEEQHPHDEDGMCGVQVEGVPHASVPVPGTAGAELIKTGEDMVGSGVGDISPEEHPGEQHGDAEHRGAGEEEVTSGQEVTIIPDVTGQASADRNGPQFIQADSVSQEASPADEEPWVLGSKRLAIFSKAGRSGIDGGLMACATRIAGGKADNQDCFRVCFLGERKALILADGVTGCDYGGEAAEIAADTFAETIKEACRNQVGITFAVFEEAYSRTVSRLEQAWAEKRGHRPEGYPAYQTTVIAIVEDKESFLMTYLGDGKLFLLRGDLEYGMGVQLLIPHTLGTGLQGILGPTGHASRPVFMQYSKSFQSGEIIIAGTDGAFQLTGEGAGYTVDRVAEKLEDGERNLIRGETLAYALESLLEEWDGRRWLSDDCTLGVIVTSKARQHLLQKKCAR